MWDLTQGLKLPKIPNFLQDVGYQDITFLNMVGGTASSICYNRLVPIIDQI